LAESDFELVPDIPVNQGGKSASLFVLATAVGYGFNHPIPVVVVGSICQGGAIAWNGPADVNASRSVSRTEQNCSIGTRVASALGITTGDRIVLRNQDRERSCHVWLLWEKGSIADDRILVNLSVAQQLANLPQRISLIEVGVPGSPKDIQEYAQQLQRKLPDAEVRPLRQFSEAQSKIYTRISGLLTAATAIILILTALCVMAAMTNIAAERKHDVGMMKAIGGSAQSILNLFFTEAVLLGLIGGLFGAAAGIALSITLGKAVFGVAAAPRLIVYPIAVGLTVIVAVLGAYPLRRLANVRPATIFRGEA
jgi:putative ABC transport system permease protein